MAEEALGRIVQLYAIEQLAHDMTPEKRLAVGQQQAVPVWPIYIPRC